VAGHRHARVADAGLQLHRIIERRQGLKVACRRRLPSVWATSTPRRWPRSPSRCARTSTAVPLAAHRARGPCHESHRDGPAGRPHPGAARLWRRPGLLHGDVPREEVRDAGIPGPFVQDNFSRSSKARCAGCTSRSPRPRASWCRCSPARCSTWRWTCAAARHLRQVVGVELSAQNKRQLWCPRLRPGFYVLSESADFHYKCTRCTRRRRSGPSSGTTRTWRLPGRCPGAAALRQDAAAPRLKDAPVLPPPPLSLAPSPAGTRRASESARAGRAPHAHFPTGQPCNGVEEANVLPAREWLGEFSALKSEYTRDKVSDVAGSLTFFGVLALSLSAVPRLAAASSSTRTMRRRS